MSRLQALHDAGVSIWLDNLSRRAARQLEREGVRSFCESYTELLGRIEAKVEGKDPACADANSVKAAHAGGQRN